MINPCQHGDQAGGHAVYCGSLSPRAPGKCGYSWRSGGEEPDWTCPLYHVNPLWQEIGDDYYENREFTLEIARRLNLTEDVDPEREDSDEAVVEERVVH